MTNLALENNFFSEGSPYLAHPLLTAERTAAEIDQIAELVGSVNGRVLDIGCGFGRHSIELASRSADVTGIDPSSPMIEAARARAVEANQFVDFVCATAADLHEVARYDLAICLFTSFGQQQTAERDELSPISLLRETKRALRPGGSLVIELPERERMVAALVEHEQLGATKVTRAFNERSSVVTERFALGSGDVFNLTYRVFTKTELVDLLYDVGFEVKQVLDRGLVEPPLTFMTVVAQRPA